MREAIAKLAPEDIRESQAMLEKRELELAFLESRKKIEELNEQL